MLKGKVKCRDVAAALMWGLAFAVMARELTTTTGLTAAGLGAFLGYFGGHFLAGSRLRTVVGVPLIPVLGSLLGLAARLPSHNGLVAGSLGSARAYAWAAFLGWMILAGTVVTFLKFLSTRYPAWIGAEVALVTLFLAAPFAAHRDGFISRPHFLVDPLWARGYDPMPVLFALGAVAAGAIILLTIGRHSDRSSALDLAILLAVVGCLYLFTPENVIKDWIPDPPAGLNNQGEPNEKEQGEGPTGPQPPPLDGEGGGSDDDNDIPFKDNYEQNNKPKPVAVVILREDYEPADGGFYFRQRAFSQFNGRRLVADTTGLADQDIAPTFPVEREKVSSFFPGIGTHKLLKTRVALMASHTNPFALVNATALELAKNPNPEHFERAYDVESWVRIVDFDQMLETQVGSPDWPEALMKHYTQIPDDPRYKALAEEIIAKLPPQYRNNKVAWAVVIKLYLDKNGIYSRRSNHMSAGDPVASFLFGNKTGYCVHFAHAAAYLYRSVGVPARVAGGYFVDARFRSGSSILVRDRESHAWPEIYLNGFGWMPLDISPEQSLDDPVMQPDMDLQRMLGEMARDEEEETTDRERKSLREILKALVKTLGIALGWTALLVVMSLYGWKIYRRCSPWWSEDEKLPRALYLAGLDRLSDGGIVRPFGQGRAQFAEQHYRDFSALGALTEIHLCRALGHPERIRSTDRKELFQHYRLLGEQLSGIPWWRRLLGTLNPFTPLIVK